MPRCERCTWGGFSNAGPMAHRFLSFARSFAAPLPALPCPAHSALSGLESSNSRRCYYNTSFCVKLRARAPKHRGIDFCLIFVRATRHTRHTPHAARATPTSNGVVANVVLIIPQTTRNVLQAHIYIWLGFIIRSWAFFFTCCAASHPHLDSNRSALSFVWC